MRYRSFPGETILRIAILVVSLTFFTLPGIAHQTNKSQQPFTITIAPASSKIKTGSNVCVEVSLTNTSLHNLFTSYTSVDGKIYGFVGFEVRFEGRVLVSHRANLSLGGSFEGGDLGPNATQNVEQCLDKFYDMSKPGQYTIQASRGASAKRKARLIVSNTVTITVVP